MIVASLVGLSISLTAASCAHRAPSSAASSPTPPAAKAAAPIVASTTPTVSAKSLPSTPATTPSSTPSPQIGPSEIFPSVRFDPATHTVEFDAWVPIDAHNPKTPRVYLELIACTVDSREHEALVVTKAKASNVHAALLLAGLAPGTPGVWSWDRTPKGDVLRATPPTGPKVRVRFVVERDSHVVEEDPATWVRLVKEDRTLAESYPTDGFVFAGSRFVTRGGKPDGKGGTTPIREYYHADMEGTLIGLTTFGMETLAWSVMWSPDAQTQTPDWIARAEAVPPMGTPVVVRLTPAP